MEEMPKLNEHSRKCLQVLLEECQSVVGQRGADLVVFCTQMSRQPIEMKKSLASDC
jgi:hypothetical protein